jgi:hypothetical protein
VTVVTTPCLLAVHVALGYLLGNSSVLREEWGGSPVVPSK